MKLFDMKRHLLCIAATVALAAAVAGPAIARSNGSRGALTGNSATRKPAPLPGHAACFWLTNFNGSWAALSHDELIVYAPMDSEPYLIRLMLPVITLRFAEQLGFYDAEGTGQICDGRMDDLVVPDWIPHRIPITAVRKLTVSQANALLVQHGLKPVPTD